MKNLPGKKENQELEVKQPWELRSIAYWNKEVRFEPRPIHRRALMSTIEDFYLDDNTIVYVGNYLDFVNEIGQSTGNSGGSPTLNTDMNLKQTGDLNLPHGLNARRITKLNDLVYLVL